MEVSRQHREFTPGVRKGQFLWMDHAHRNAYLYELKKKISDGYYSTEKVISHIVDEIAPVLEDVATGQRFRTGS